MQAVLYDLPYAIYVLVFGVYVAMRITCGRMGAREWRMWGVLSFGLLLAQAVGVQLWGMQTVRRLYPALVHLPLFLTLVCLMRIKWYAALAGIAISYSLCQLLRWIGLAVEMFAWPPVLTLLVHIGLCQLLLMLLSRFCLSEMHGVVSGSARMLGWFGALPVLYYAYEYLLLYAGQRFSGMLFFSELLPTAMVVFFVLFAVAYQRERISVERAKKQADALEMKLAYAENEISTLRVLQEQTAIYRHDLRHHLRMIGSLLASGQQEQALQYICREENELETITPVRYCENETVNLLLSAFRARADRQNVGLNVQAALPQDLRIPERELCALLSNGLENALNAAALLPQKQVIDVYGAIRQNSLLIEIKNSYAGQVKMADGLPVNPTREHSFGCRSIQSIVLKHRGLCSFEAGNGIFVLRMAIPLEIN